MVLEREIDGADVVRGCVGDGDDGAAVIVSLFSPSLARSCFSRRLRYPTITTLWSIIVKTVGVILVTTTLRPHL